jgi:pentatricopeptide repeat protein
LKWLDKCQLRHSQKEELGVITVLLLSSEVVVLLKVWHPSDGISDVNPAFCTKSPIMTNQGYAGTKWRNVRKRSKPAMWRYALRTFDRMALDDRVKPAYIHYEGALLACAKLGLAVRALEIYRQVETEQAILQKKSNAASQDLLVHVNDNMIMSVIKTCVRASVQRTKTVINDDNGEVCTVLLSIEERRATLDGAVQIAAQMEAKHDIPLCAVHLNPLAKAYQKLGLLSEANNLLRNNLQDRVSGPEAEIASEQNRLNIYDVKAKDKGSYSLLVQSAVTDGDWGEAIDALREMTEAGLFPANRHLNAWTGISERKKKQ